MSGFILCGDGDSGHTLVPNLFLDKYMPEANGEYVKIYLYLLRCLKSDPQELSVTLIADKFENTESDVQRALKYWEKMRLLRLEYDSSRNLTGIRMLDGEDGSSAQAAKAPGSQASDSETSVSGSAAPAPQSSGPVARQFDPLPQQEAQQLLFICEQYLGKTLTPVEVGKILDLHELYGFSAALIEYLVEYCVSGGHRSIHYIEATARGWHEDGYTSVAQAKEQTTLYNRAYFRILKAFGISGRNPVEAEIAFMKKWLKEYGFSMELITEACSRTISTIHQPSFPYADKILTGWREKQITSPEQLKSLDQKYLEQKQLEKQRSQAQTETQTAPRRASAPNRFHNFQEREYDYKELEKQLINQ